MTKRSPTRTKPIALQLSRTEHASAETIGAVVLLAVIVTVISVASIAILDPKIPPPEAAPVEMAAEARAGSDSVLLTRLSGLPLDMGDLAVAVDIDDVRVYNMPMGESGQTWALGEPLVIGPLPVIQPGQRVEVSLLSSTGAIGSILTTSRVDTGPLPTEAAPLAPSIVAASGTDAIEVRATQSIFAQATVDHPGGRKMILSVTGQLSGIGTSARLHDDGILGDPVAGDGRYVASFTVPVGTLPGVYPLILKVTDLHGVEATTVAYVRVLPTPAPAGLLGMFGVGGSSPSGGSSGGDDLSGLTGSTSVSLDPTTNAPTNTTTNSGTTPSMNWMPSTNSTSSTVSSTPSPSPTFSILPTGGVSALCAEPVRVAIIGTQITFGAGGPVIPVTAKFTQNGGSTFTSLAGGAAVQGGEVATFNVSAGAVMGIRARATYLTFDYTYDSWVSDPHVKVLKNGDLAPDVAGFANQTAVAVFLAPYVYDGVMQLAANQVIYLFEFNPSLLSTAADFQDLVVLMEFPLAGCSPAAATLSLSLSPGWISEPTGGHYSVNVIGLANGLPQPGGMAHVMFVPLGGACKFMLAPGTYGFTDRSCGGDGISVLSLPNATAGGSDHYRVFLRALGDPAGMSTWTQCFGSDGTSWCSNGDLSLVRAPGAPLKVDGSAALFSVCNDPDLDGVFTRGDLFSLDSQDHYWDLQGNGLRVVQMRIYPVPAPAAAPACSP